MPRTVPLPTSTVPTRCIERHPTKPGNGRGKTVYFAGVPVSLSQIARSYDPPLDISYLSLIFRGKRRNPGMLIVEQIATALGMQLQAFVAELKKIEPSS